MIGKFRKLINKPITGNEVVDNSLLIGAVGLSILLAHAIGQLIVNGDVMFLVIWMTLIPAGLAPIVILLRKAIYLQSKRV